MSGLYDHEGRRLADITPRRFCGERRFPYSLGERLSQAGAVRYGHDKAWLPHPED